MKFYFKNSNDAIEVNAFQNAFWKMLAILFMLNVLNE